MKLLLTHGYPYPFPKDATPAEQEAHGEAAAGIQLEIAGVTSVQTLHTVTVEFDDQEAYDIAQRMTGWAKWSDLVLEVQTSAADGYDFPAWIVRDKAYCGVIVSLD